MFDVSVDELLGYKAASTNTDIILELKNKVESLPKGEDFDFTFKAAAALHAIIFSKGMKSVPKANIGLDTEDAIEHAGNGEWGYSCMNIPEITTTMRKGTVMFSNNRGLDLNLTRNTIRRIVSVMKDFADYDTLRIASAMYTLTVHDENAYTTPECISEKCRVSAEKVTECLNGTISSFVKEDPKNVGRFRFSGRYMNIIPLISLFDIKG